ncbi:MAG: hypothetical protein Q7R95_02980 [bacterium]|nr:hypothetical protein [bacterium]
MEYLFYATIPYSQKIISTNEGISEWIEIEKLLKLENVFPPSKYYLKHILNSNSGIKYNFSEWKKAQLVKVINERIGK